MGATVETKGLDRLLQSWDALLKQFPERKRRLLERVGQDLLRDVRANLGGSGKVAGWQEPHMGSGGGYVAVRPKAKTYQTTKSGKQYAVGHITNAIEGGHKHGGPRGSSGPGYHYRPRFHTPAVPGRWFYKETRENLAAMSDAELQELVQEIVDGLEGRL